MSDTNSFTVVQCSYLVILSVAHFMQYTVLSLQGPFYPPEALIHGVLPSTYGFIMGFYRFMIVILTPLFGIYVKWLGLTRCFWLASFLLGIFALLFGLIDWVDSRFLFITLSVLFRGLEAIAAVGIGGLYIMIDVLFPDRTGIAVATIKMMGLYGFAVGPLVGTLIGSFGGFTAIFMIVGGIQLVLCTTMYFSLPKLPSMKSLNLRPSEMLDGFCKVLLVPSSLHLFLFGAFIVQMAFDFVQATFEPYLHQQFNATKMEVGIAFLLLGALQPLCVVWGFVIDRIRHPEIMIILGCFVGISASIIIGPISFLQVDSSYPLACAGSTLFGLGHGALFISCFSKLMHEAKARKLLEGRAGNTVLPCAYLTAASLGGWVGSFSGGILYDEFGFRTASIFILVAYGLLGYLVLLYVIDKNCNQPNTRDLDEEQVSETKPLLEDAKELPS